MSGQSLKCPRHWTLGCIRKNSLGMLRHSQHDCEDHNWNQDQGSIEQDLAGAWLPADFPVCEFVAVSNSHMLLVFQIDGELSRCRIALGRVPLQGAVDNFL